MKRFVLNILLLACGCIAASAQTEQTSTNVDSVITINANTESVTPSTATTVEPHMAYHGESLDSLHLPELNTYGQVLPVMHPLGWGSTWGGWNTWGLHKGLNLSLGASVFASFGKHAPHGAGFMQSVSAMYAEPLSKKLTLAVGGYFNNINWGGYNTRTGGVSAVLGYQFDEHWEGYIYAQKQLMTNMPHMPYPMYDCAELGDRIGAAVKYNFSPSFSVQVSVERDSR